jgi:TrmH family RNA methyltransferase
MDIITSTNNQSVAEARSLNEKKFRLQYAQFLIEGKKQVQEAIDKGIDIDKIFVDSKKVDAYNKIVCGSPAPIYFCTEKVIKSISDTVTPQGIVAVANMPPVLPYRHQSGNKILVLDGISDPGNMGTIIRSAAAVGFDNIFTINCVDAFSPKVVRSTCGGIFLVNIYPSDYAEIINLSKKHNISLLVADMDGKNVLEHFEKPADYAIIVGNEGNGVSQELSSCGTKIALPMKKTVESLNAAVSASVIMYALEGKNI